MSCKTGIDPEPIPKEEITTIHYLALGDSYTIGETVPPSERWPVQLADTLRGLGYDIGEPKIIARTGWTTDELSRAIKSPALIFLEIVDNSKNMPNWCISSFRLVITEDIIN